MSRKVQQKNLMIAPVAGILITYFLIQFMFIKSDLRELEEEITYQQHWITRLEDEIAELRQEDHMVKESRYNFKQCDGVGTLVTYEIELSIEKDFSDALNLYYKTFDEEEWRSQPLTVNLGEAKTLIELDTNYNYDLKVGFMESEIEVYETLPVLDLYTEEGDSWASSIQTTSLKGNQLKYNIQLAKGYHEGSSSLAGAVCRVYYAEVLVDEFEVREMMMKEKQQAPKAQLEHFESDYWFVNRTLELSDVEKIEQEKVRYEVEIYNDRGNLFKRTYFIEK